MPATETLIALSALGPALFKSSIPVTAALSASGAAALPATSAPAASFAVTSAAGGSAACCGIKSLSTALLLTKKGGAAVAAKAGSGFLSLTKGAAPAAGGSAASAPASVPAPAGPTPTTGGSFSSYSPPHVGGSTPQHHISPFQSHSRANGLGAGGNPPRNASSPPTSAGGLPTQHVRHNPVAVAGGKIGGTAPPQPGGTHHPWHHSAAGGGGDASNSHHHLQARGPQPRGSGRSYSGVPKSSANSHSRTVGNAPLTPVAATDAAEASPAAAAGAEQAGAQQSAGSFLGAGSHEATVISTLVGVALLRWAISSLCFGRNTRQGETSPTGEATAAQVTLLQKNGVKETEARIRAEVANVKKPHGQWSGRRVERWKRDSEFLLNEGNDFEHAALPSKLPDEIAKHAQSSDQEVLRRPPILEVCLSECEGDDSVIAQGEAVETVQDDNTEWHLPDPPYGSEQLLTGTTAWQLKQEESEEKKADWCGGGFNVRPLSDSHSRVEGVSDTTVASSRSANELPATSEELTKKKQPFALYEAFHQRRSGRIASFL